MAVNIVPISGMKPLFETASDARRQEGADGLPFADLLQQSLQNLQDARRQSQQDSYDLAMGTTEDLAAVAINSAKATAALELTVEVASRAVSAYKEILQMQI